MNCPLCQSIDRVEFDAEMVINAEMVIHFSDCGIWGNATF
jgi:hypothetical protein